MIRRAMVVSLFVVLAVWPAPAQAQDTAALARILAEKGLISRDELAQVVSGETSQSGRLLAKMLYEKGLLTEAEMARIAPPAGLVGSVGPRLTPVAAQAAPQTKEQAPPPKVPSAPITLYGTVLWNSFFNTATANIEDVPMLAGKQGADALGNDKNFGMTVRQSRMGMRYQGPQIGGAKLSALVEGDLYGGKAALPNGVSMDMFRLRLAYGRLDWKNVSLVAGQDWSVFAPLNPTSLASFAIPALAGSGNPWIRTPQLRAEFRRSTSEKTRWQLQVAALDPNVGDYPAEFRTSRTPAIGERGRLPGLDARLAWTTRLSDREMTLGLSSHYSRGKNAGVVGTRTVQLGVDSWGTALDYSVPLLRRVLLTGELFTGRALGIFSASIGQAVLPVGTPGEHGVEMRGGWLQTQVNLAAKWQVNLAYGIDAPEAAALRAGDRSRNQTYMGNLLYKFSPQVTVGGEWRRFLTDFQNQRAANERGDHVNLAIAYVF